METIDISNKKTVDYRNKASGKVYVYEVLENYWDKEKKQSRSRRKLLGVRDPITNEVIPTSKSKKPKADGPNYEALYKSAQKDIKKLNKEISSLKEDNEYLNSCLLKMQTVLNGALSVSKKH